MEVEDGDGLPEMRAGTVGGIGTTISVTDTVMSEAENATATEETGAMGETFGREGLPSDVHGHQTGTFEIGNETHPWVSM